MYFLSAIVHLKEAGLVGGLTLYVFIVLPFIEATREYAERKEREQRQKDMQFSRGV
jgi:hypothetical protein